MSSRDASAPRERMHYLAIPNYEIELILKLDQSKQNHKVDL